MELKYVGDLPLVSHHGVCFDKSHPDKFIYLHAVLELLEALSYGATEATEHLYTVEHKEIKEKELLADLEKYLPDLEELERLHQQKAHAFVQELEEKVQEAPALNNDEREVYIKNIEMMKEYYYQYVTNETVYEAAIESLALEIKEAKIEFLEVPAFRNYGIVLKDLKDYMEQMKAPIDTDIEFLKQDRGIHIIARFTHY